MNNDNMKYKDKKSNEKMKKIDRNNEKKCKVKNCKK